MCNNKYTNNCGQILHIIFPPVFLVNTIFNFPPPPPNVLPNDPIFPKSWRLAPNHSLGSHVQTLEHFFLYTQYLPTYILSLTCTALVSL